VDAGGQPVKSALALAALLAACAGCVAPPTTTYVWCGYEESLYRMYLETADYDAAAEAQRLAVEVERAQIEGLPVAPGVHAHLAMLCDRAGDAAGAEAHLRAEKAAFPESAVFVDGLLARMRR
jgi:hypothetical protein